MKSQLNHIWLLASYVYKLYIPLHNNTSLGSIWIRDIHRHSNIQNNVCIMVRGWIKGYHLCYKSFANQFVTQLCSNQSGLKLSVKVSKQHKQGTAYRCKVLAPCASYTGISQVHLAAMKLISTAKA